MCAPPPLRARAPPPRAPRSLSSACARVTPRAPPCAPPCAPPQAALRRALPHGHVIAHCGRQTLSRGGQVLRGGCPKARVTSPPERLSPCSTILPPQGTAQQCLYPTSIPPSSRPLPQMRLLAFERSLCSWPAGENGMVWRGWVPQRGGRGCVQSRSTRRHPFQHGHTWMRTQSTLSRSPNLTHPLLRTRPAALECYVCCCTAACAELGAPTEGSGSLRSSRGEHTDLLLWDAVTSIAPTTRTPGVFHGPPAATAATQHQDPRPRTSASALCSLS